MNAHYVFAGGGTGGHLFPGIAVAHAVRAAAPDARITFFTTNRPLDAQLLAPTGFEQVEQVVQPFTLHPLRWPAFLLAWRRSVAAARRFLKAARPRAVLGLGGYAAGPAVVAARQLGLRTAILNPDAIPGRANRHLARSVDLVVTQWDVSHAQFRPGTPCRTLGCPIRAEFAGVDAAAGRQRFGLAADRPLLLVTGASQGARTINEALVRVWPIFRAKCPDWQLLHLTGPADEAMVRTAYAAAGAPATVLAFTHEMALALAAADVVIARAGASTLAELTTLGRPGILLPYPYHKDRHQHANAQVLVDAGAALLIEDRLAPEQNAPALAAALERVALAETRQEMAAAAGRLGRPQAAADVAGWLQGG
jgi:UDP-N-acetylglucosamine--N-acetylmuramyl-(pentapeptide) pyrophosphoryl-undecaprenol N-acetylglucosamine transferase